MTEDLHRELLGAPTLTLCRQCRAPIQAARMRPRNAGGLVGLSLCSDRCARQWNKADLERHDGWREST